MNIVLDANRFFSALLKDGSTRKAIYDTEAALFAPEFLRVELERHTDELLKRTRLTREEFTRLIAEISAQIVWIPDAKLRPHMVQARDALEAVDVDDVPYLACALAVSADAIWSHDRDFDEQALVPRIAHPSLLR